MKSSSTGLNPLIIRLPLALVVAVTIISTGCLSQTAENTGAGTTVKIGDILENPGTYNGMTVVVSGKIVNECPSGCWFFLDDGTGTIYVDLLPSNFAIPQIVGSHVTVKGTILVEGKDITLVGNTVMTGSEIYP